MIEKKKSETADLEKKRFAFFQIGLVVAGALCLAAFEYSAVKLNTAFEKPFEEDCILTFSEEPEKQVVFQQKPVQKQKIVRFKIKREVVGVKNLIEPKEGVEVIDIVDIDDFYKPSEGGGGLPDLFVDTTYEFPDVMPEFPGGEVALMNWIGKNIKVPSYGMQLAGIVYVSFVVNDAGEITNVKIAKSLHSDYDKASMAVVKKMPKWTPGEQNGKAVKVRYNLPIRFVNR